MEQAQPLLADRVDALSRLLFFPVLLLMFVAGASAWATVGTVVDGAAVLLLILLTALSLRIFARAARADPDGALLYQALVVAWLVKLVGMTFKFYLAYAYYGGLVDAFAYHEAGQSIMAQFAAGQWPVLPKYWGTEFVGLATGLLYLITGPSIAGGWVVWTFLGSLGMLFHYKAFVTALPGGHRRLYMLLVLFAPSIIIWTNSVGKDALSAFFLGMTAYGIAQIARRGLSLGALFLTGIGAGGVFLVRPHLAGIVAVGLAAALVLRPIRAGALTPIIRLLTLAGVVAFAVFVVRTSASVIGVEDLSVEGVTAFFESEQAESAQGGSAFVGVIPTTPQGIALGIVTVLFRPFPWETTNLLALASALEGTALMLLILWRFRSVLRAIRGATRNAYLGFLVIYVPIFVIAFSAISNFGILVRQRVQLLPFLFAMVAIVGTPRDQEYAEREARTEAEAELPASFS